MHQQYTFENSNFEVRAHAADDGDVIITISKFPVNTTFYMTGADAKRLSVQILEVARKAIKIKSKEVA